MLSSWSHMLSHVVCTDVSNAFQICHADKSFHVFARSSADKGNWVGNLQKHISRVASSRRFVCARVGGCMSV